MNTLSDPVVHIYDPDCKFDIQDVSLFHAPRIVMHLSRGDRTCDVWEVLRFDGIGGRPTHRSLGVGPCTE